MCRPAIVSIPRIWPLPRRTFSHSSRLATVDFTHAIIGGGVVGLAIAQDVVRRQSRSTPTSIPSTVLLERHAAVGTEISSRNSEVIHAGLYYGADTLKTTLCVRGRPQLYGLCRAAGVPYRNCGKWIVAQTADEREKLQSIHDLCVRQIGVPVRWVGSCEATRREPLVRAEAGVLESPTTGIVDSHALMMCLLGRFEEAGGTVALNCSIENVTPLGATTAGSDGWELRVRDTTSGQLSTITAQAIVNAAGLGSVDIHNMIVPESRWKKMFYAKGNYFSYQASTPSIGTLIYPAPTLGAAGLGTHLTLDLGGRIRFGPDVEWVDSPHDLAVNPTRLPEAVAQIRRYLPSIDHSLLTPDYAGIRPKLARQGAVLQGQGFVDFIIREEEGYRGWVNVLNIESPGLTSCLAIAERVRGILYG